MGIGPAFLSLCPRSFGPGMSDGALGDFGSLIRPGRGASRYGRGEWVEVDA